MALNCKPGDLAVIIGGLPEMSHNIGRVVTIEYWVDDHYEWQTDARDRGFILCVDDRHLRPIRDQPGNENFVTEARKQLTGGKTEINARGELRV